MPDAATPGWNLLPNRTVILVLDDGRRWRFRAPTLGELRKVTEATQDANDAIALGAREMIDRQVALEAKAEAKEITAAERLVEDKRQGREWSAFIEQTKWEALTVAFDLLADEAAPMPDDCPAWLYMDAAEEISALLKHWKSCPPRPGTET